MEFLFFFIQRRGFCSWSWLKFWSVSSDAPTQHRPSYMNTSIMVQKYIQYSDKFIYKCLLREFISCAVPPFCFSICVHFFFICIITFFQHGVSSVVSRECKLLIQIGRVFFLLLFIELYFHAMSKGFLSLSNLLNLRKVLRAFGFLSKFI